MKFTVKMSPNRVRIIYKEGKKKWYGELTKKDFEKGLGWFQWGSSTEDLCTTMHITEQYAKEFIEMYHLENEEIE